VAELVAQAQAMVEPMIDPTPINPTPIIDSAPIALTLIASTSLEHQ
jgi:hypothetical protein